MRNRQKTPGTGGLRQPVDFLPKFNPFVSIAFHHIHPALRKVILSGMIVVATMVLAPVQAQDQDPSKAVELLNLAREMRAASQANDDIREILMQAADADTTNLEANYEAGNYCLTTIKKDQAVRYFLRVYHQSHEFRANIEYKIGQSYQYALQLDHAIEFYQKFREKVLTNPRYKSRGKAALAEIDRRIEECRNGLEFLAFPKEFKIENLGKEINSEADDYGPVLDLNEELLIFTSRRRDGNLNVMVDETDNLPFEDIFTARRSGEKWTMAKNIGEPVNSPYNDSNLALSPDGKSLYTYHDRDIYVSDKLADGNWSEPKLLPSPINSDSVESSITITQDGNTIYFSSNRFGGLGGKDIYSAKKGKDGLWTEVRNLGPAINTEYDEDGPYIDPTGAILYYSSKGKKGMGGFDLFRAGLLNAAKNTWSEPENLGYPINTPDDDIFFVGSRDSKRGYYASVREGGFGYLDIYRITIPEFVAKEPALLPVKLVVKVQEAGTLKPLDSKVTLHYASDNATAAIGTELDGATVFYLRSPKSQEYILSAEKSGYLSVSEKLTIEGATGEEKTISRTMVMEPGKDGSDGKQSYKLLVTVIDARSRKPIEATVSVLDGSGIRTGDGTYQNEVYEFNLMAKKGEEFRIAVEKNGYVYQNQPVTMDLPTVRRTIALSQVIVGSTGIMRYLFFDFASAIIKDESIPELRQLENLLRTNPNIFIEVEGHTDDIGGNALNKTLSQKRANAVKAFLVKQGIADNRITTVGYGETRPLVSNDDEESGRAINRRVAFRVLK